MRNKLTTIVSKGLTVLGLAGTISSNSACVITFQSPLNLEARLVENQPQSNPDIDRRYNTTAHRFLDLENELGANDDDYKALDDVIDKAKEAIKELKLKQPVDDYGSSEALEALKILQTIDDTLRREDFSYKLNTLLNKGLKTREIDCDNLSVIYLAIGEELNLPLKIVLAPKHAFIRWNFKKGFLNWETTFGSIVPNEYYVSQLTISEQAINNGLYLKSLDKDQVLAVQYVNVGSAWLDKKDYEKAAQYFNEAIALNPKLAPAYVNLGNAWYLTGSLEKAIQKYDLAIGFDSNCLEAYANKWIALTMLGRFTDINYVMDKANKLGIDNIPYLNRFLERLEKGEIILRPVGIDWPSVL
ncbi:MAG: tetratricopeptide repeat protein [Nanoarchaeota archaeon]|nr:tetratricopeptide repeat protein [Nanoarchaeota archaeon]MBU1644123.1 tetratricopeptide repeat protein [Nanoarchaeota archaeon]MBU1976459.1 tetratricopeptide repeat protein [Nanoarchaeota archaeon]